MGQLSLNDFDTKLNPVREDLREAMSKPASSETPNEAKSPKSPKTKTEDETKPASSETPNEAN
ncbi:hypothetical protein EHQ12_04245 [Leptospira gomenensis]|uniref:Uncharacterized protein n=1 Tax=Leptospira gomenensis TaxID=2484974 RepID=A0A5F1YDG1_9LEPT|nr:hypothetical protein [Leptospira gomenensis]TGK36175.1 hypothetical protein EHQ17_04470 [Leptospira gomenensis]TGK42785.1 hypothetical protein EHQ07_14020 [Leptospira gomenensis]TGK42974.1 hypothetical protein EHQ12_04245 [Leptospira gomenensis]TGK54929.1 hypothetical protein EHQ13_18190 [Leptospira gomenensis]